MRKHLIRGDENGAGLFGEVSVVGKPGTASQFQRRELVAVPALRRTHRSAFSRECCYDREHLTAGQSHVPAAIKRGLCECGGPETRDLCLNGRKIVVRDRLFPTGNSTL